MELAHSLDIGSLEVVLEDVALPMGLIVNAITLSANSVHLEQKPFKVEVPQPGSLVAMILADNLARFLDKEAPGGLRDFKVDLKEGKIYIQASIMIMKAAAVCTLRIVERTKLFVELESVDVMGVGAKNMVQSQLEKINPVIDAGDLPVPAELTHFEIGEGKLILYGSVSPPVNP